MHYLGAHVSIAGGLHKAFNEARKLNINTFQVFTRNPRGWKFKPLDDDIIAKFHHAKKESGIEKIVSHMPYLPNPCSPDLEQFQKSLEALLEELDRCSKLGIPFVVMHIGHHKGQAEKGWENFKIALERAFEVIPSNVMLLAENSAGERNSIGTTPEDLQKILAMAEELGGNSRNFGFCFDTCHAHAGGADLSTPEKFAEALDTFHDAIDLSRIQVVHLNDAKAPPGSGLDRHENIGDGTIGIESFKWFLNETDLARRVPLILETPIRKGGKSHVDDLRILRKIVQT